MRPNPGRFAARSCLALLALTPASARAQIRFDLVQTAIPEGLNWAAMGDVDGDGRLDCVVDRADGRLVVYLGRGAGLFEPLPSVPIDLGGWAMALEDCNGDGLLDVIGLSSEVAVLLGDGTGAFAPPGWTPAGSAPYAFVVEDLDGDSNPDVAVVNTSPSGMTVLWGDGTGGFSQSTHLPMEYGYTVEAADFNGDGNLDLLTLDQVHFGDGMRGFEVQDLDSSSGLSALHAQDLDLDGRVDLVSASGDSLHWYRGDGAGGFSLRSTWNAPGGYWISSIATSEIDEDGFPDAAFAGFLPSGAVIVTVSDGSGGLAGASEYFTSGSAPIVASDVDDDGHMDLVVASNYSIDVFLNRMFDAASCLRGNVNAGVGVPTDVVFVNDSSGIGALRTVRLAVGSPLVVRVDAPPSRPDGPSPFALYAFFSLPQYWTVNDLPYGIGEFCHEGPFSERLWVRGIANNIGHEASLGIEDWPGPPTRPAPSLALNVGRGLRRSGVFFLQGLIVDRDAPNGRLAVTNGVTVQVVD